MIFVLMVAFVIAFAYWVDLAEFPERPTGGMLRPVRPFPEEIEEK